MKINEAKKYLIERAVDNAIPNKDCIKNSYRYKLYGVPTGYEIDHIYAIWNSESMKISIRIYIKEDNEIPIKIEKKKGSVYVDVTDIICKWALCGHCKRDGIVEFITNIIIRQIF